jgi:hypothetical protein
MFREGLQILTILNVVYKGGANQFIEDGGMILPYPDDDGVFIFHPDITEEFTKKLMLYDSDKYHIQIVSTLNRYTLDQLIAFFAELQKKSILCAIEPHELVFYITFNIDYDSYISHTVLSLIRRCLPGVQRVSLIFTNKNKTVDPEPSLKIKTPTVEKYPKRDTIIKEDDITNFKIELALCEDVQQLIDKM